MLNILVNGAHGRMGQEVVNAVNADPELKLVATADKGDDLAAIIASSKAHVVVDFTVASVAWENANRIIEANVHPVIGTTGFTSEQIQALTDKCAKAKLGGIIAPNFSIGAILLMKAAADIARYFPQVEIIEMHHDGKEDAPSGTALKTAEGIAANRLQQVQPPKPQREAIAGVRGGLYQDIPIHSVRLPGILAFEEVIFGGQGETLSIRHNTLQRSCFMPGVILACKKVSQLNSLIYGLDKLL